jgi:hypothetical protein
MKQFFFLLLVFGLTLVACQKDSEIKGSSNEAVKSPYAERGFVSQSEYADLDPWQKEVANLINSSIGALNGMSINGGSGAQSYRAEFTVHFPLQQNWDNGIFFYKKETKLSTRSDQEDGELEGENDDEKKSTCHVTGLISARSCINAIKSEADAHKCVNVTVQSVPGGYDVTYEGVDNC